MIVSTAVSHKTTATLQVCKQTTKCWKQRKQNFWHCKKKHEKDQTNCIDFYCMNMYIDRDSFVIYFVKYGMKGFLENLGVHFNTFVVVIVACCSTMITVTALYFGITSQLAIIQKDLVYFKPVTQLTMKLATNVIQLDYMHDIKPEFEIDYLK